MIEKHNSNPEVASGFRAQVGSQSFVRFGLFILIDQLISLLILI